MKNTAPSLLIILFSILSFNLHAQDNSEVLDFVEEMPQFEGRFSEFLAQNLMYPEAAIVNNTEGKVYVQFVVKGDGSVAGVKTIKGIGDGCDEEAERVIKLSNGKWTPGTQNKKPVNVRYTQAVNFRFTQPDEKQ